jgi:hypothetical protein
VGISILVTPSGGKTKKPPTVNGDIALEKKGKPDAGVL